MKLSLQIISGLAVLLFLVGLFCAILEVKNPDSRALVLAEDGFIVAVSILIGFVAAMQLAVCNEHDNAVRMRQIVRHFDDWLVVCRADNFIVTEMSLTLMQILERKESNCIGREFSTLMVPESFQERHRQIMQSFVVSNETRKITDVTFKGIKKSLLIQKIECADGLYLLAAARSACN